MADQASTTEHPTTRTSAEQPHQPTETEATVALPPALEPCAHCGEAGRLANWLLGVEPQDVRFPVNIVQLAFTSSYFAALTSDRRKIYVNRRSPGWCGNCKKRSINFPAEQRPGSIVSYDNRDTLCVVFRCRVEFHSLANLTRVGVYETATVEVAAVGARAGRSPLGALWCSQEPRGAAGLGGASTREAAFTVWTDRTEAPKRALLLGPSVVDRPERFLCFYWTSAETVLLVSQQEVAASASIGDCGPGRAAGRPLVFCAYDTTGRRPVQRLCRRSVQSAKQFCLSPDGRLLLISGGSRNQLLDAATLRQVLALPRSPAVPPHPMAVTNAGDLLLLTVKGDSPALEIQRGFRQPTRCELGHHRRRDGGGSDCRVYAVGEFGALVVSERDSGGDGSRDAGDLPGVAHSCSLVTLIDLEGNVIMQAEWPRANVQLVSEDLLVYLRRMSVKPFSAAHACIFDFNSPVLRRSCWASTVADAATAAGAAAAAAAGPGKSESG